MSETAEEQRWRLYRKRQDTVDDNLIQCLECPLKFVRLGSHVVQVHGYENAVAYRKEHGLTKAEMVAPNYKEKMHNLIAPVSLENIKDSVATRFPKGERTSQERKEWWENRLKKQGVKHG